MKQHLDTTTVLIILLLITLTAWFKMRPASNDPYGLFHLTLNELPFQDPNAPPETEWLNMGYWRDAKTFPEACKALAMKLIKAANVKEGGRVLDVGHGTGESLLLLISEPSIPHPSHLVGITSLEVHHQRSVDRVQKYQASHESTDTIVDLYHADAVYDPNSGNSIHPLRPTSKDAVKFDSILALDCAYHFNTRRLFLEQSFAALVPEGRIALADICFSSSALNSRRTKILTSILRLMHTENKVSIEEYISQMQDIGYVGVILEDITEDVFPGFAGFLKSRGWGWWVFGWVIEWYMGAGARFLVIRGKTPC